MIKKSFFFKSDIIMEIALIAGMGMLGYYMSGKDQSTDQSPKARILSNDVPNGFDIYNQNRLSVSEQEQEELAERSYTLSQYPEHTNIVPDYYNQLGPLLNKMPFDNRARTKMSTLYDPDQDLDDIYSNRGRKFVKSKYPNDIYKPNHVDRKTRLLNDLYEDSLPKKKPFIIPGVARRHKRAWVDKNTQRPVGEPQRFVPGADTYVVESFSNLNMLDSSNEGDDLLEISESLTDNSNSIKRILSNKKRIGLKGQPTMSPEEEFRTKRLIGVDPSYKWMSIDDDNATYPAGLVDTIYYQPNVFNPAEKPVKTPEPSYLYQFEEQTYDNIGLPQAPNDIYRSNDKTKLSDLERQLSYQGGWSQYNQDKKMSYGVVSDQDMIHDNMMPFFSTKTGYGTNDLHNVAAMDRKKELFTGNLTTEWRQKQEVKTLFNPVADMSYVYGTPIRPEGEESRYIPGRYYQNELLWDPERITPGLNLDYNEIGTQGNFDMVRMLPKNVDELRTLSNPKITDEGRIIVGLHGSNRPVQAEVISYRPDGFKVTTEEDLLPKSDLNSGPKTRENFIMKEQNRPDQQIEYTGGAYTDAGALNQIGPDDIRPMLKISTKPIFTLPKPLQKFAKNETEFNPNIKSFQNHVTARSQTGDSDHCGPATNLARGNVNIQDSAKQTIKEVMSAPNQTYIGANTMRGTAIIMDVANPTMKEVTEQNKLNPNVGVNTMQRVYLSDIARPTMSEATLTAIVPSNIDSGDNNMYANWTDEQKITMKQTTIEIPRNTQVVALDQAQRAPDPQDLPRITTKQTTVSIPLQTMVVPVDQSQRAPNPQDRPRTTLKQTTNGIVRENFITPIDQAQRVPDPQDTPRTTLKQTTVQTPWNTFTTPINQSQRAPDPQDRPRVTGKQLTVEIPYNTMVTPINQSQRAPDPQDRPRVTGKELTVEIPYNTMITPVNQSQRAPDPQDQLRTTIKESTVIIPYNTMVTPVDQSQRAPDPQDRPRVTAKQLTVDIPRNTNTTPVNQSQRAPDPQDRPRNTQKQSTCQKVYFQGPEGDIRERSYYADYNAEMDDRKEMLLIYYPPTTCNADLGPNKEIMQTYAKPDNEHCPGPLMGVSVNNQQDRPIGESYINAPRLNVPIELHVNPKVLTQLDTNPYNIPYFGNRY